MYFFTLLGVGAGQSDALPYIGMEGRTMRSVAVGPGGVWAVAKVVDGQGGGVLLGFGAVFPVSGGLTWSKGLSLMGTLFPTVMLFLLLKIICN